MRPVALLPRPPQRTPPHPIPPRRCCPFPPPSPPTLSCGASERPCSAPPYLWGGRGAGGGKRGERTWVAHESTAPPRVLPLHVWAPPFVGSPHTPTRPPPSLPPSFPLGGGEAAGASLRGGGRPRRPTAFSRATSRPCTSPLPPPPSPSRLPGTQATPLPPPPPPPCLRGCVRTRGGGGVAGCGGAGGKTRGAGGERAERDP